MPKTYRHRRKTILSIIAILGMLLSLMLLGATVGPGFDPDTNDRLSLWLFGLILATGIAALCWLLWRNSAALVISEDGLHIPTAFRHPLPWDEVHRIRRVKARRSFHGRTDWLIIDMSPGLLAPLRLHTWRRLDLWFQNRHGIRIPLHGLEADPEDVVHAIEQFRPVTEIAD